MPGGLREAKDSQFADLDEAIDDDGVRHRERLRNGVGHYERTSDLREATE